MPLCRFCSWLLILGFAGQAMAAAPALVVVVSIDQFPYEYLERMRPGFRPEGIFLRMCDGGANFTNCHHGHAFTKTAPGHSVMLTGAFPARNGIINNEWYDPSVTRNGKPAPMYCVDDPAVQIVGDTGRDVGRSPKNLLVDTLGDRLKLIRPGSRVFGISLKDRAAILMTGHAADGAYWLEGGKWVTSTYYRPDLPPYLRQLNEQNADQAYLGRTWSLLYPLDQYTQFYPDDAEFEGTLPGSGRAFPHPLPKQPGKEYATAFTTSPFGNDYTLMAARALVAAEQLGQSGHTDLLALNLSSNDYVGHRFGPHSLEVQDITYRTDRQLGDFAGFIGKHLGSKPWVLVITSDHGVAPVPEFAATLKLPAGRAKFNRQKMQQQIETALARALGQSATTGKFIKSISDEEIYLDHALPELQADKLAAAERVVRDELLTDPLVAAAFTRHDLIGQLDAHGLGLQFQRTCHPARSGDVLFALTPYQISKGSTATHGSPWQYDTHVPMLFWGTGIRPGRYDVHVTPAAIAPTLAKLLVMDPPAGCEVEALSQALAPSATAKP